MLYHIYVGNRLRLTRLYMIHTYVRTKSVPSLLAYESVIGLDEAAENNADVNRLYHQLTGSLHFGYYCALFQFFVQ